MLRVTPITHVPNPGTDELSVDGQYALCSFIASESDKARTINDGLPYEQRKYIPYRYWFNYQDMIDDFALVNKEGKLVKRIAKLLREQDNWELSEAAQSEMGNIIAAHSYRKDIYYDVTDRFDWQSGDFGDGGSCFWGGNSDAKTVLADNNCLALRFYNERDEGVGRCWVAPRKHGWLLFNAYGPTLEQVRERVKVIWPHAETKLVRLSNHGETDGLVYINRGLALYLTFEAEEVPTLMGHEEKQFKMDLKYDTDDDGEMCSDCGCRSDDGRMVNDDWVCDDCYEDRYFCCERCYEPEHNDNRHVADMWQRGYRGGSISCTVSLCKWCYENSSECMECHNLVHTNDAYHQVTTDTPDGEPICAKCIEESYTWCENCNIYVKEECECEQIEE